MGTGSRQRARGGGFFAQGCRGRGAQYCSGDGSGGLRGGGRICNVLLWGTTGLSYTAEAAQQGGRMARSGVNIAIMLSKSGKSEPPWLYRVVRSLVQCGRPWPLPLRWRRCRAGLVDPLCEAANALREEGGNTIQFSLNNSEECSPVASAGPLTVHNHVAGHIGWRACLSLSACEAVEVSVCRRASPNSENYVSANLVERDAGETHGASRSGPTGHSIVSSCNGHALSGLRSLRRMLSSSCLRRIFPHPLYALSGLRDTSHLRHVSRLRSSAVWRCAVR